MKNGRKILIGILVMIVVAAAVGGETTANAKTTKKLTSLQKSKKAFRLQNKLREAGGVPKLQWSDEVYQFARYRLKTSGFDGHAYLLRNANDYFGKFFLWKKFLIGENLTEVHTSAKAAVKSWRESKGHYENLMGSSHVCGAIAEYKGMWIAIFLDEDKSFFDGWKQYSLKRVTLKRYDSTNQQYVSDFSIGYYEVGNRLGTVQGVRTKKGEKNIYLEVGKTYYIYERTTPDGCGRADPVTITIEDDSDMELILEN